MSEPIPSVFVSHGSPAMALGECPARTFLQGLGDALPAVREVLCVSATGNRGADPRHDRESGNHPRFLWLSRRPL